MADLNRVFLMGNLTRDPEVRYTASGKAVATFTVATSFAWKDQDGTDQEKTEWHRVVAWGRLGEICGEYLSKGQKVYIEGRIQSRDWEDQDGNKRYMTEIVAQNMQMLDSQGKGGSDAYGGAVPLPEEPINVPEDDIPF